MNERCLCRRDALRVLAAVGAAGALLAMRSRCAKAQPPCDVSVRARLEDYSWDELSAISRALTDAANLQEALSIAAGYHLVTEAGKIDGSQTKALELQDGSSASVFICGIRHDLRSDGLGQTGLTFMFRDAVCKRAMNEEPTNAGGWAASQMRGYLDAAVEDLLPYELASVIVPVEKRTNNMGATDDIDNVNATSDRLWLFSAAELGLHVDWLYGGTQSQMLAAEGSTYQVFYDTPRDSAAFSKLYSKAVPGATGPEYWWERSPFPYNGSTSLFCVARVAYPELDGRLANKLADVVPGFCV